MHQTCAGTLQLTSKHVEVEQHAVMLHGGKDTREARLPVQGGTQTPRIHEAETPVGTKRHHCGRPAALRREDRERAG